MKIETIPQGCECLEPENKILFFKGQYTGEMYKLEKSPVGWQLFRPNGELYNTLDTFSLAYREIGRVDRSVGKQPKKKRFRAP